MNFSIIKPALAVINNPILKGQSPTVATSINYTQNVLQTIISIFFLVAVVYFFWHAGMGGYHFIASEGSADEIKKAKNELEWAFVGLVIVFSLFAIMKLIGIVFGIDILNLSIPTM